MTESRPGPTAAAMLAVAAMLLGGCQGATDADAPAPATGSRATDDAVDDVGATGNEGGDAWATKQPVVDNGVSALPADEIVRRARTALHQAKSFHATGTLYGKHATVNNGQPNEEEALLVSDASGAQLFVPVSGDLLPIQATAADESGLDFGGFGEAYPDVKKPPAAQVVDYNFLVGE